MISNYSCKKCNNFNSKNLNDLKKHLLKKKTCPKTNQSFIFSEDQLLAISILPNNTSSSINIKDTEHLKDSNIMNKNKFELFELFKSIEKKKKLYVVIFATMNLN